VEVPFARESEPWVLTTNVASDSCTIQCALTMRSIMALGKSAGSSLVRMSTGTQLSYAVCLADYMHMGGTP
jgi:hypothetical protein